MIKKLLVSLLLFGSSLLCRAQEQKNSVSIDSLRTALTNSSSDDSNIKTLIQCALYFIDHPNSFNLDSAGFYLAKAGQLDKKLGIRWEHLQIETLTAYIDCCRQQSTNPGNKFFPLIAEAQKENDKINERDAWIYLSRYAQSVDSMKMLRLDCEEHLIPLHKALHFPDNVYGSLRTIADIHLQLNKFDQAEGELLQITRDYSEPSQLLYTYDLLAGLYIKKGQFDKALDYALKTQKMVTATGDTTSIGTFYYRLGKIYFVLKDYPNCLAMTKKVLYNQIALHQYGSIPTIAANIADIELFLHKPDESLKFLLNLDEKYKSLNLLDQMPVLLNLGNAYAALHQFNLAEKYYLRLIEKGEKNPNPKFRDMYYQTLANFYFRNKKYDQAKKYDLKVLEVADEEGMLDNIQHAHSAMFKVDSALGDYISAIKDLQISNRLNDSIYNITKNKQIEELQIAYRTEQKEKDLKLLQDKEKLDQITLKETKVSRNWIVAGSIMLFIIAGLLFRQNKLKQKSNQIITHKNELLEHLVSEKEWLLKEVHHRVKNNLHTVICLLESQAVYLENDALKAIESSQHRIYAMSLIHQKLYQGDDIKAIDMTEYLPEFIRYLSDSFGSPENIQLQTDIQPLKLGVSQAIPVGLIINEAVTNCFKYAFPYGASGKISISLQEDHDQITLIISDNGIGMPSFFDQESPNSMGVELIKGLARDLSGTVAFNSSHGTRITLRFRTDPFDIKTTTPIHTIPNKAMPV